MSGEGVVLDAETAAVVPDLSTIRVAGESNTTFIKWMRQPLCGDILTHIGGRPVAELVAAHDEEMADARWIWARANEALAQRLMQTADDLDALAWRMEARAASHIDPAIVAAWHAQHDGEVE